MNSWKNSHISLRNSCFFIFIPCHFKNNHDHFYFPLKLNQKICALCIRFSLVFINLKYPNKGLKYIFGAQKGAGPAGTPFCHHKKELRQPGGYLTCYMKFQTRRAMRWQACAAPFPCAGSRQISKVEGFSASQVAGLTGRGSYWCIGAAIPAGQAG